MHLPSADDLILCAVFFVGIAAGWMWNDILGGNRFYKWLNSGK